jgi:ferric-dicitrate binding protein FerR (iron transport regulator)
MISKRKLRLFSRYFASACNERERSKVEKWIAGSEKHKRAFDDIHAIWELSAVKTRGWKSERVVAALRLKLKQAEAITHKDKGDGFKLYRIIPVHGTTTRPFIRTAGLIAAVLVGLSGAFYVVYKFKTMAHEELAPSANSIAEFKELSTMQGQLATLNFSDGTKVLLNSDSRLRYTNNLTGNRYFYLDGEAYFEVVHSDVRPLIVRTAQAVIRDVGTRFDVSSWADDNQTKITVADGEVLVHPGIADQIKDIVIPHGQCSSVKEDGTIIRPFHADVSRDIAWTHGELVFHNEPMTNVIKQLRRKYGLNCSTAGKSILTRTITATLDDHLSTQQVLKIISLSLNLTYRTFQDSVYFEPARPKTQWNK